MPYHNEADLYTQVRGVNIPTFQIKQVEGQYGVKLVPDEEYNILLNLDLSLKKYREERGKDPDLIMLADQPEFYYKHMVLNIHLLGMELPGSTKKPAWFRFKRNFNTQKHKV